MKTLKIIRIDNDRGYWFQCNIRMENWDYRIRDQVIAFCEANVGRKLGPLLMGSGYLEDGMNEIFYFRKDV